MLGVRASGPVQHRHDFGGLVFQIGGCLLDRCAHDPLLQSSVGGRRRPHRGEVVGKRCERVDPTGLRVAS